MLIVGFSYAGFNLAQNLWDDFDVTVIDQNQYFEHIFTNIKSSVDPAFPDRILHSFDKMAQVYPKLTFKQAKLVQVNLDDSVFVEMKDGKREKLTYDVLVLCTGFSYDKPVKDSCALSMADRKKTLLDFNEKVAKA